jgi:hypothetical protein
MATGVYQSQEKKILAWMMAGHRISPALAYHKFGSLRLGARIHALKKRNRIKDEMVCRRKKHFKEFWMAR